MAKFTEWMSFRQTVDVDASAYTFIGTYNNEQFPTIKEDSNRIELKSALESKYPVRNIVGVDEAASDLKQIYDQNNLQIFLGDMKERCILLKKNIQQKTGQQYAWCISREDASNMFSSYRYKGDQPTFYYVYDADKPVKDIYHAVVIYPTQDPSSPDNEIDYFIATANNPGDKNVTWDEISEKIPKLRSLEHLFKVIPYSKREKEFIEHGKKPLSDEDFSKLSYDQKEDYIGFGHRLSETMIRDIFKIDKDLVNKFCNSRANVLIPLDIFSKMPQATKRVVEENFSNKEFFNYFYVDRSNNNFNQGITIYGASIDVFPANIKTGADFTMHDSGIKEIRGSIEALNSILINDCDIEIINGSLKASYSINLRGNKLKTIPLEIETDNIELKNNPLEFLPDNLNVKNLDLRDTTLKQLPKNLKAKSLDLMGTSITEIPPDIKVDSIFADNPRKLKIPFSAKIYRGVFDEENKNYISFFQRVRSYLPEEKRIETIIEEEVKKALEEMRKLSKPSSETNLRDWFKRKGAPGKKGGWVDCNTCRDGKCKPCGRQEGESRSKYPRCRPTPSQCKGYSRRGDNLQKESNDKD